ncbi:MAG: hypothetical protein ACI9LU_002279 [Polaribacter sp.]
MCLSRSIGVAFYWALSSRGFHGSNFSTSSTVSQLGNLVKSNFKYAIKGEQIYLLGGNQLDEVREHKNLLASVISYRWLIN